MIEFIRNVCLILIVCFVVTISFHLMNKSVDFQHANTVYSTQYLKEASRLGKESESKD